ncbi:hypothetical protein RsS62_52490 [Rhizobium dioscoreae]|nr:hypothetical protein RsS62_52490 [Rhizobium dioscoreae]
MVSSVLVWAFSGPTLISFAEVSLWYFELVAWSIERATEMEFAKQYELHVADPTKDWPAVAT